MEPLLNAAIYEGVDVDFLFEGNQPKFGDVFLACGYEHRRFRALGQFGFKSLHQFGFEPVDDYFGVPSDADNGDDVIVWLYPLAKGKSVHHHPGPFSGVRLSFNVLRNTEASKDLYLRIVEHCFQSLSTQAIYQLRKVELDSSTFPILQKDIEAIIEYWKAQGVEPGSKAALRLDY